MTQAIVARGVAKRYRTSVGVVTPVDGFDLTLEAGELVVLQGPSGCGKTTVVHLLAGWEEPDRGTIEWPAAIGTPPLWSEVAVIPQTLALLEELTVAENITLPLRAIRPRPRVVAALTQLLEELGLTPLLDRSVDQISVGEQQRVMIARALASRPAIILADEPTAHQDELNAGIIVGLLHRAAGTGAACLLATRQSILAGQSGVTQLSLPPGG
jgi:putative ABC transport system ATP-binding protein